MTTATINWQPGASSASGSVAATLAMTRAVWEAAGATFTEVKGGNGQDTSLAAGTLEIDGAQQAFAVLEFGDDITYLTVGGDYDERPGLTARITTELLAAGAIPSDASVLEIVGLTQAASTDEKLDYSVSVMAARMAETEAVVAKFQHDVLETIARLTHGESTVPASIEAIISGRDPALAASTDIARISPALSLSLPLAGLSAFPGEIHSRGDRRPIEVFAPIQLFALLDENINITTRLLTHQGGEAMLAVEAGDRIWDMKLRGLGQFEPTFASGHYEIGDELIVVLGGFPRERDTGKSFWYRVPRFIRPGHPGLRRYRFTIKN
ncbi:hypothetical protein [Conexibacter sp. DBS9H8]|uniref:hypothetical protein n=1 Tax=Conexibacter sp. DBS9H8 TaxID=2937801 RepID=UPI00200C6272|nr:hypothetical protein [Conexibacter sp. DBS9H8]